MPWIIKDWDKHYETAASRKITNANWVPVPNKHDGRGLRRLLRMENGIGIFGTWMLILQVASKMPTRGTLEDESGALSPLDIADKCGATEEQINAALGICLSPAIGWVIYLNPTQSIEVADQPNAIDLETTSIDRVRPEQNRTEQKGTEENRTKTAAEVLPQSTPEPSKVTQMRPVTLLERDTGWDQIREVWDDGATVIPGEGDWSQALVHWRRLSFEEKKLAVDDRVEMARMLKAGEFHVSSGGLPQSYFQHKHFGRRVKASAAQTRSRPKSKQDQIADAFAAVERNIHAGYRTEP